MNTLFDFSEEFRLYACCGHCNRSELIDRSKLSSTMLVSKLRERVRCRECGGRTH